MATLDAEFRRRAKELITRRLGRGTPYAYSHRPKGGPRPRLSEGTIKQWFRPRKPSTPFSPSLVTFAEEMGTTLDYLVLGRGPTMPGLYQPESDLAAELRRYLVEALSRRAAEQPYQRQRLVRFFEGLLPKGQELLDALEALVLSEVRARHRERWDRTRKETIARLARKLEQLEQVRDPMRDRRAIARIKEQIVAGVRSEGEVPLLLDEASSPRSAL